MKTITKNTINQVSVPTHLLTVGNFFRFVFSKKIPKVLSKTTIPYNVDEIGNWTIFFIEERPIDDENLVDGIINLELGEYKLVIESSNDDVFYTEVFSDIIKVVK